MTHQLTLTVKSLIERNNILDPDAGPVVVGLSGGPDSVALLAILTDIGYDCIAAHANFHLRGDESERDASFARRMALRLGAAFVATDFDIDAFRRENGGSLEMACRTTRYDWMRRIAAERGAQAIAVGHHRDDNVETVLLNLTRGTGIAGLTGMGLRRDDIARPLLTTSRKEILDYLAKRGLDYVTDSSNKGNDYVRNRLRNIAIPALTQAVPGSREGIITTASYLDETSRFYRRAVTDAIARVTDTEGRIDLRALATQWGDSAPLVIYEHLRSDGISRQAASDIMGASSGARFEGTECIYTISLDRHLSTRDKCRRDTPDFPFDITIHPIEEFAPERNPAVAYFDESVMEHALTSRTWRRGDRMHPYGMKGSKLLSDLFVEARIDAADRDSVSLLMADDEIIFAGGVRASSRYTVGPLTRRYVRIECTAPEVAKGVKGER